jgi:hypothetical protein
VDRSRFILVAVIWVVRQTCVGDGVGGAGGFLRLALNCGFPAGSGGWDWNSPRSPEMKALISAWWFAPGAMWNQAVAGLFTGIHRMFAICRD